MVWGPPHNFAYGPPLTHGTGLATISYAHLNKVLLHKKGICTTLYPSKVLVDIEFYGTRFRLRHEKKSLDQLKTTIDALTVKATHHNIV